MTKLYALRLAEAGIAVFEIRPGVIRTDMTAVVSATYEKRIAEGLTPGAPLGRAGGCRPRGRRAHERRIPFLDRRGRPCRWWVAHCALVNRRQPASRPSRAVGRGRAWGSADASSVKDAGGENRSTRRHRGGASCALRSRRTTRGPDDQLGLTTPPAGAAGSKSALRSISRRAAASPMPMRIDATVVSAGVQSAASAISSQPATAKSLPRLEAELAQGRA